MVMFYQNRPRSGLDFPRIYRKAALDAPGKFISSTGILLPTAMHCPGDAPGLSP
jgi:hypothetical protein